VVRELGRISLFVQLPQEVVNGDIIPESILLGSKESGSHVFPGIQD
jgi:hypothetical protein